MKLSVLDQSPVREGVTPADAVHETIELARHVDGLGYHRYWLAEHHSSPGSPRAFPARQGKRGKKSISGREIAGAHRR